MQVKTIAEWMLPFAILSTFIKPKFAIKIFFFVFLWVAA